MRTRQTRLSSSNSQFSWNVYLKKWMDFRVNCIPEVELPHCRETILEDYNPEDIFTKERISNHVFNIKEDVLASWSEHERDVFTQRFIKVGKDFPLIADALLDKTVAQCIHYYYLTKHRICYKQLRKMAIDEECETHDVKSRGVGKGDKKSLDQCLRNAEKNTGVVVGEKPDKNVSCAKYDALECKKAFISDNSRINKPGTSTATTRENSFEDMEGIQETGAKDEIRTNRKGPKGNRRGTGKDEGDKRRKGKALNKLCATENLFANIVSEGKRCRYNANEKHENISGTEKFTDASDDYPMDTNQVQGKSKGKYMSSGCKYHTDVPDTATYGMIQDNAAHKNGLRNHYSSRVTYNCKGRVPKGVYKAGSCKRLQLQNEVTKSAQPLISGNNDKAGTSNNAVLCNKKVEAKNKGKCFIKAATKSFDKVLGELTLCCAEDKQWNELGKQTTVQDHNATNCKNIICKKASTSYDKNQNLNCPRNGAAGANTNQCCDKYCNKKGLNEDICCFASKQRTTEAENAIEERQSCDRGNVKARKLKKHGNDVQMKSLKKQSSEAQCTSTGHSSTSSSEAASFLVSTKEDRLMTADPTRSSSGNVKMAEADSKGKGHKRKGCTDSNAKQFRKQTATVDQFLEFFDEFDALLFNKAGSDQAPNETNKDHHRISAIKERATAHAHIQGNELQETLTSCDSRHGKRPVKEKRLTKDKDNDSCTKTLSTIKNQGYCPQSKVDHRASAKHGRNGLKYIKQTTDSARNANLTKETFDLATASYDGITGKCNVNTGEQAYSYDDYCRITRVTSKRTKERTFLSVVNRLAKETRSHSTSDKATFLQDSDKICANGNKIQSESKVLNEPTTSRDPRYINNFTSSRETNSTDTDCQITCVKENRLEKQEKSFIDVIIEATKTTKPSFSGDLKVLNQEQIGAEDSTKRNKRKITSERFDREAFKKAFISNDNNNSSNRNNRLVSKETRLAKNTLFDGSGKSDNDRLNMAGELDMTPQTSYIKRGDDEQQLGVTSVKAVIPGVRFSSYTCKNHDHKKA